MGTCDVLILAKDNYFKEFIKLRESLNEIWSYKYEKLQKYDSKTGRIINTNRLNPIKKVIVIADAEGGNVEQVKESITKDIPEDFKDKVRYIIFKYSIEEWICDGLCIDNKGNPEETVNNYIRNNSIRGAMIIACYHILLIRSILIS